MNRLDLIIDALESCNESSARPFDPERVQEALAAARELKSLKPVAWMGSAGFGYDKNKYLSIPLYALDGEQA